MHPFVITDINQNKDYNFSPSLKPNILFFYDYFYPGYKAGGPIQSLTNLALALQTDCTISVVTSVRDLHAPEPYKDITSNTWNTVFLPGSNHPLNVYYADAVLDGVAYQQIMEKVNPTIVYFNNIYSGPFFRLPLQILKSLGITAKVVICPRGMLQQGALAVKPLKKKIYLSYLRYSGLLKNASWHATNQEELQDIQKNFPVNKGITVACNIPKRPYEDAVISLKETGKLKLVYLSLITEKKNLLLLMETINECYNEITLDIYGPIKDADYWQSCKELIKQMPDRVTYKGDVQPVNVQEVLSQYDSLILLTKGENFGHALYESLSVGRPIITSHFTPWVKLNHKKAGWNVGIEQKSNCINLLNQLAGMDTTQWEAYCVGAHQVAMDYYNGLDTEAKYKELFSP